MKIRECVLVTFLGVVSACTSTTKIVQSNPEICHFPGGKTFVEAPAWVCGTPVEGYPVSAVGSFKATEATSREQAVLNGRAALALEIKSTIKIEGSNDTKDLSIDYIDSI